MNSALIILVAFATLRISSFAQQSREYGLSKSGSATLLGIIDNQNKTLSANLLAVQPIFDLIEILSTVRKYNLKLEDDVVSSVISGAILTVKNASDHTFNSIPVILGRVCYSVEIARNAAYGDLENAYEQIRSAFELAVSGNYTDIRTQFEVFSVEAQKYLTNFISRLHDTIRSCVHTTNSDTQRAMKIREIASLKSLLRANNAMFDAIKVFAAGIPAEDDSAAIIPDVKIYRERAKYAVTNVVEHNYSPIRGLYISTQLNQPENGARFTSEQYAQIRGDSRFGETGKTLLGVVRGYLTRVQLGLSDACNDDSSAIDDAEAKTAANFKAGLLALVESVQTTDPVILTAAATTWEYFNNYVDYANGAYFKTLRVARGGQRSNISETLEEINTIQAELRPTFSDYIHKIFKVVQLGSNATNDFFDHESNALAVVLSYVDKFYAATRLMAESCYGIRPVTEDDFKMLRTATNELDFIVKSFNSDVSTEHVSVIKTFVKPPIAAISGAKILILRPGLGFTFN